jgi:hypothetical protein
MQQMNRDRVSMVVLFIILLSTGITYAKKVDALFRVFVTSNGLLCFFRQNANSY